MDGPKKAKLEEDEVIKFNVRCQYFGSLKQTLLERACPKSPYFEVMLSGKFAMDVSPDDGAVFLDRNPDAFKVVWNYLLDEPQSFERCSRGELQAIRVEADYFQVDGLAELIPPTFSRQSRGPVVISVDGTVATATDGAATGYVRSSDAFLVPKAAGQFSEQRVKMLKEDGNRWISFGVAPEALMLDPSLSFYSCGSFMTSLGLLLTRNGLGSYGASFDVGAVVSIRLHYDMSVSFLVDGVDQGVAFTVVDMSRPLFLTVILYNRGDSVQMMYHSVP